MFRSNFGAVSKDNEPLWPIKVSPHGKFARLDQCPEFIDYFRYCRIFSISAVIFPAIVS